MRKRYIIPQTETMVVYASSALLGLSRDLGVGDENDKKTTDTFPAY